jgi:hypothetical protein
MKLKSAKLLIEESEFAEQIMSLGEINVNVNSDTDLASDTEKLVKQA